MGVSFWLQSKKCKECGNVKSTDFVSITYNINRMWYEVCLDSRLIDIDNYSGKKSLKKLQIALNELKRKPELIKLNPENGWGSYDLLINCVEKLIELAKEHPSWIWLADR